MCPRLLLPVQSADGDVISGHFGRAPYFLLVELDDDGTVSRREVFPNTGEHSGGRGHAHDNVLAHRPDVVIVQGMGPRGLMSFQDQRIAVLKANTVRTDEILDAFVRGELVELTEGCVDARH